MPEISPSIAISFAASVLVCIGYAPEFVRLWRQRSGSVASLPMWLIWTSSALLSTIYSAISLSPFFVIANISLVFFLTFAAALGNLFFVCLERRKMRSGQDQVSVIPCPSETPEGWL